jgi:mannose-6-phosphate isomerase
MKKGIYQLKGKIQHYAWGGRDFIPAMLNIDKEDRPYAEYWMGAHHNLPSEVILPDGSLKPLHYLIEEEAEFLLGNEVEEQFGGLPYLFKLLDVHDMLSIQVHPSKEEAEIGYEKEDDMGIPLNAPHRNYKDTNHKPEILVALGEFWLLHGFKKESDLLDVFDQYPALALLKNEFETGSYRQLYKKVMTMPQVDVDTMLLPMLQPMIDDYNNGKLTKNNPDFWAARAVFTFCNGKLEKLDRGIFSIFFFNIVHLQKGEALFQGAGVPHAYLEGQCMELMSNSDNVLRGGLTPKHIDVPELMKHIRFEATIPAVMKGEKRDTERIYHCPIPDFMMSAIELKAGETYSGHASSLEIIFCTEGSATEPDLGVELLKGNAYIITAVTDYDLQSATGAVLYKASVPLL